jgi:hypothetical protein
MKNPGFGVQTTGKRAREAFECVVKHIRQDNAEAVYRSGSAEEYTELKQIVDHLIEIIDDIADKVSPS